MIIEEMTYLDNSTTNIANIAIEITEVADSRAQFDVNQVTEHTFVVQNTQMSSSVDIASIYDSSVHALLEFIGVELHGKIRYATYV
ncbi:hypothetical protein L1987_52612 [Smallanthus sonchifolius]|uniref:Uncharacterized protein n=1 Tax=Smallanthus sonchifolius TaxID=185202 RepID=A0ACB9ESZ2_9ASTR|nr:hypothetical protein L1987_52612 [Smallanthus sonchifolius]